MLVDAACFVQDPSIEDRQAALFNSTCVHASFGDVEFAQVTLRGTLTSSWASHLLRAASIPCFA